MTSIRAKLLSQIPEPDENNLVSVVRSIRDAIHTLGMDAQGQLRDPIFAKSDGIGHIAALAAMTSSGTDATVQFSLIAPANVCVIFGFTGFASSAAGSLLATIDNAQVAAVAIPISSGNALPFTAVAFGGNIGSGPHTASVTSTTGLSGFTIAVIGSTI